MQHRALFEPVQVGTCRGGGSGGRRRRGMHGGSRIGHAARQSERRFIMVETQCAAISAPRHLDRAVTGRAGTLTTAVECAASQRRGLRRAVDRDGGGRPAAWMRSS